MLEKISEGFAAVSRRLSGKATISEKNIADAIEEIKKSLLEADVNLRVVRRFVNNTTREAVGEKVLRAVNPGQQFVKIVHDRLLALLGDGVSELSLKGPDTTSVIVLVGLQGSGKTTAAARLAYRLKNDGRRPLLAACDLQRPAAVDQLSVLGGEAGVDVYTAATEKLSRPTPLKVAAKSAAYARKNLYDVLIVDTAGRLHADEELMKEISDIEKEIKPDDALLVADSMTGQSAVNVAKSFSEAVGLTGVILTKFDSDTRGGAALSLKTVTGQPVKFIGVGEKLADLEPFYPERIVSRMLGMGDVVSLVEKAQQAVDEKQAAEMQKKIISSTFTLVDYLEQMQSLKKMGNMKGMLDMLPASVSGALKGGDAEKGIKRNEAMIRSMTPKERLNHRIINVSRRKRIARGSGCTVADVNRLLKNFDKSRLMMKKMMKNRSMQAQMVKQLGL